MNDKRPLNDDEIEIEEKGKIVIIHLPAHYTIVTGAQIIELEGLILQKDIDNVIIEASKITAISSFGLEHKILEQSVNQKKTVGFSLINASKRFQQVIDLMSMSSDT